jgi:hypothetical protein
VATSTTLTFFIWEYRQAAIDIQRQFLGSKWASLLSYTVQLGDKERFDKEQIGVKEPFPMTNLPIYFIRILKEHLALANNFRVTKKFLITKFDCNSKIVL